jgi:hypothetical protein
MMMKNKNRSKYQPSKKCSHTLSERNLRMILIDRPPLEIYQIANPHRSLSSVKQQTNKMLGCVKTPKNIIHTHHSRFNPKGEQNHLVFLRHI